MLNDHIYNSPFSTLFLYRNTFIPSTVTILNSWQVILSQNSTIRILQYYPYWPRKQNILLTKIRYYAPFNNQIYFCDDSDWFLIFARISSIVYIQYLIKPVDIYLNKFKRHLVNALNLRYKEHSTSRIRK